MTTGPNEDRVAPSVFVFKLRLSYVLETGKTVSAIRLNGHDEVNKFKGEQRDENILALTPESNLFASQAI